MARRRHRLIASFGLLTEEQSEQKRLALRLHRRADVLAMGVASYIQNENPSSDEMRDLSEFLLEASEMAQRARELLRELEEILEASERQDEGGAQPN